MPQQVDEPNSTPFDVQKTLNTTPLTRDAISKFMPGYDTSGSAKSGRPGRFFMLRLSSAQALSTTFLTASLALPTASCASPLPFCKAPLTSSLGLPTAFPAPCLIAPAASLAMPLILSVVLLMIWSPDELMAARSPALHRINATIWVRVAPKMIFVEKVFDESLSSVAK